MKKKQLTKGDELQIIDHAITQLGTDSYLGPWLTQIRSELIRDLRSDILPTISLDDAAQQAEWIVRRAEVKEDQIVRAAEIEAGQIMVRAEREATRVRDIIREASNKLLSIEERL
jgi:L-fucose mutarotase/ribose pyranase (RbsD/FucU family)